jgi:hypothetical protein
MPTDNTTAGLGAPLSIHGPNVRSVTFTSTGGTADTAYIQVEYTGTADPKIDGSFLALSPGTSGGQVQWYCGQHDQTNGNMAYTNTDLEPKYLPSSCR